MFGFLSSKISGIYNHLRSPKLSAAELDKVLAEIETYLLEADAPFETVHQFIEASRQELLGNKYPEHLNAQQAVVKVLHAKLTEILGSKEFSLQWKQSPLKVLVVGLQGTGKSTSVIKLAAYLKQQKKSVLVVSFDIHRPAAREQTEVLAKKIGVDTAGFQCEPKISLIAQEALKASRYYDVLLIDTAGRSEIDAQMMEELTQIHSLMQPQEKLYVLDAMAGQSALQVAKVFHEAIGCTGSIVTKLDSDARGGAILGLRSTLGIPIMFLSLGEHVDKSAQWSVFHPDRIAQRILGMGDLLSLIEKLDTAMSEKQKQSLQSSMSAKNSMNFEDLLEHLESVASMAQSSGGVKGLLQHIPGMGAAMQGMSSEMMEAPLKEVRALIQSMTKKERKNPSLLEQGGRKKRIAEGAGKTIADVNALLKKLKQMDQMKAMFSNPGKMQAMMRNMPQNLQQMMGRGPFNT